MHWETHILCETHRERDSPLEHIDEVNPKENGTRNNLINVSNNIKYKDSFRISQHTIYKTLQHELRNQTFS